MTQPWPMEQNVPLDESWILPYPKTTAFTSIFAPTKINSNRFSEVIIQRIRAESLIFDSA